MNFSSFNKKHQRFLTLLLVVITIALLLVIKDYIIPIVLAIVFVSLLYPFYKKVVSFFKGRTTIASSFVLLLFVLLILIPSYYLVKEILNQAFLVTTEIFPVIEEQFLNANSTTHQLPEWFPMREKLAPYTESIFAKVSEIVSGISDFLVSGLNAITQGTISFFISFFVMLYAMYSFLIYGEKIIEKLPDFLPLTHKEVDEIFKRINSISRATLKGAFLIGIVQGLLVGFGFWVIGIPGALFWAAITAFMSLIPSLGAGFVYLPAVAYLYFTGQNSQATFLLLWGVILVSNIDNFLRPYLVGKDTQMPDLLILISTLGGISLFGLVGIIIGPLIAGIFITISKLHREAT